jgi:hypothetical protein
VSVVPQLAHLKSTSSAGEPFVDHRAPLMMKDSEPRPFSRGIHRRSLPRFFTTIVENKLGVKAELLRMPFLVNFGEKPFHALR